MPSQHDYTHDADRRRYWRRQMDQALEFMDQVCSLDVNECLENLVHLPQTAEQAGLDVTFSEKPHVDGLPRLFCLREGLAEPFLRVAEAMNARGWVLHVEDGYRTVEMQKKLACQPYVLDVVRRRCCWESGVDPAPAELLRDRLAVMVAAYPKVGTHMSGSAIDISVYRRDDGTQVDRGGDYLEMSELTPMDSPFVSDLARENRQTITQIFAEQGFVAYPFEFWHYSSGDAFDTLINGTPSPRYGAVDWDATTNTVTPIADLFTPLNSADKLDMTDAR